MDIELMKQKVLAVVQEFPIKKITLFGSRADNTYHSGSDVDLIIEFSQSVSLITLSKVQLRLEEILELDVDVVHGPLREDDMIEVTKEVDLYVA